MPASAPDTVLHLWRSRTIDSFAQAEAAIERLSGKASVTLARFELIGTKLEKLLKAKPTAALGEERKAKIDTLLAELAPLLALRNDLVHAPMQVKKDGEHAIACFANPLLRCDYSVIAREIAAPRLQALATKVAHIAKALEAI